MNTENNIFTPIQSDCLPVVFNIKHVPEFIEFTRWNALPAWHRKPRTQKEFAKRIGVSQDTLTDWKKHPEFWPLVWQFIREWMREQTPDIIGGLYEKIVSSKGSASDIQLFFHIAEDNYKTLKKKI